MCLDLSFIGLGGWVGSPLISLLGVGYVLELTQWKTSFRSKVCIFFWYICLNSKVCLGYMYLDLSVKIQILCLDNLKFWSNLTRILIFKASNLWISNDIKNNKFKNSSIGCQNSKIPKYLWNL